MCIRTHWLTVLSLTCYSVRLMEVSYYVYVLWPAVIYWCILLRIKALILTSLLPCSYNSIIVLLWEYCPEDINIKNLIEFYHLWKSVEWRCRVFISPVKFQANWMSHKVSFLKCSHMFFLSLFSWERRNRLQTLMMNSFTCQRKKQMGP